MKLWNKNVIQDFLTQHFNRAVAIGITTSFEPYLLFPIDIFQSNMNELKTFCNENGYAPNSLDSCLKYLMHELDTTHKNLKTKLQNLEDTPEGAYNATYLFAKEFLRYEMNAIDKLALTAKAQCSLK